MWVTLCAHERLSKHKIVRARVADLDVIIVLDGDDVHVCERACPHEQADLSLGHAADGKLFCPRHLAWFSLDDGAISPGWSCRALRRFPVKVEDGQIWIDVEAL